MRRLAVVLLLVCGLAAAVTAGIPSFTERAVAQVQQFACPKGAVDGQGRQRYTCTFTNNTGAAVDDIHIVFLGKTDYAGPPGPNPAWTSTLVNFVNLGGGPTERTEHDWKGPPPILNGGTFVIELITNQEPVQVKSWYWTVGGTPVPCPEETPTPTPEFPPFPPPDTDIVFGCVPDIGGTSELLIGGSDKASGVAGGSTLPIAAEACGVLGALALSGWYVRRRFAQR